MEIQVNWRIMHNERAQDVFTSQNISIRIKSRKLNGHTI
jgi:hypothetical protein